MRANTLITLGASIACAGLAVFLAKGWINDAVAQHNGNRAFPAAQMAVQPDPTIPVLVAELPLDFGDELTRETLTLVDYPEGSVPDGAMHAYEDLLGSGERIVALARMNTGEPVLDFKVSLPGSRAKLASVITPGMRATAIRVSANSQVAGFVLPGDRVDVLFIRDEEQRSKYGLDMRSDVILQNVRVLGVDQTISEYTEGALPATTVTLEVGLDDVQRLALASEVGSLNLALRALAEEDVLSPRAMKRDDILHPPAPRKTVRRRVKPTPPSPKPQEGDPTANVVVVRGDKRDEVRVISERQTSDEMLAGGTL